ncbi:MAG: hypothetical protein SCK70_10650 [bacterium]|nr:hypothetical protein [bacterium]
MKVQPVNSKSLLRKFINFPYQFYQNSPHWIAPLKLDQKNIFNPDKNSMLQRCDYQLMLLIKADRSVGRIAIYLNRVANDYWGEKIGFFGHYECIDDQVAANELLQAAQLWLQQRGMEKMRGPWNLVTQDIGFICDGFEMAPTILSSYNPEYYNSQVIKFGMSKVKDLLVYHCDTGAGYRMPDRFLKWTDKIARRYRVTVRSINLKKMVEEAQLIVRLTNASIGDNWGYYPVDEAEAEQMANDLKMIIHPELVLIAEIAGQPIGYVITLPDVNEILKTMNGRLFPFGIIKLWRGIKKLNRYRIWAMGLLKPYQNKGISVLLFRRLQEALAGRDVYVEANWVLEDNMLMNNALRQLKFEQRKRYRIYEKDIV